MSLHTANPFRRIGTQLSAMAELLLQGKTREEIFKEIYPLVLNQREPFIYSDNVNGNRVPKPVYDQIPLAFYAIGRIRGQLLEKRPDAINYVAHESAFQRAQYGDKAYRARLYEQVRNEYESATVTPEPISEPEPEPTPTEPNSIRGKLEYLYKRLCEIRLYVDSRKIGGREFDFVTTRAFVHGRAAVIAGIEPEDFLYSIGVNWPAEAREACGLNRAPDYAKYCIEGTPLVMGFVIRLMTAGIPVYLYGPPGSGKSVLAGKIAEYLEVDYAEIPLSLGVSRTDLFGSWNAQGFVPRAFTERYGKGGVFCFEEIDAADPNILLAVNNSIANKRLFNSSNGEEIGRHETFMPIATANTLGNGATSNFGGREGLDASTLDRFKYGRVFVDYDPILERDIMFSGIDDLETVAV